MAGLTGCLVCGLSNRLGDTGGAQSVAPPPTGPHMKITIQWPQGPKAGPLWLLPLVSLVFAGCGSTHQLIVGGLAPDTPTEWREVAASDPKAAVSDLGAWWLRFSDPDLTSLIGHSLEGNTDVQQGRAALEQASALRDVVAAARSATLGYSASALRNFNGDGATANSLQAGLNAGWNADPFGAQQRALDASNANVKAVLAQWGGVQGRVASAVALNYIALRSTQARLSIAQQNLASQQDTLQLTRWRNQAGLIGAIEVEQALLAAQQTGAQLPALQQAIGRTLHALAVQTGHPPAALMDWLTPPLPLPQVPLKVANLQLMTPAAALLARADVNAAQFAVERAASEVEEAQARRYPTLNLSSNLGVGAASVAALSNSSALLAGVAVSLAGNLIDGDALQAQVRVAKAALMQARSSFRSTQLIALQEVEDALISLRTDQSRAEQQQGAVATADRAAAMARQRFSSGLVDFQIVLETQRSQFAAQDSKAQADAVVSSDQVRLYSALGGGWKPGLLPLLETAALPTTQ